MTQNQIPNWRRQAKLAVILSAVAAVTSPVMVLSGFAWGFTIPIADGGLGVDTQGADIVFFILIFSGYYLGLYGLISNLFGIIAGWNSWKTSGSPSWFIAALILPILQVLIFAVLWPKS